MGDAAQTEEGVPPQPGPQPETEPAAEPEAEPTAEPAAEPAPEPSAPEPSAPDAAQEAAAEPESESEPQSETEPAPAEPQQPSSAAAEGQPTSAAAAPPPQSRAAGGAKFYKGDIIDVDTVDGLEKCALILGAASSGDRGEMRIKFADGVIDDWDVAEFVKLPPASGRVVFTHHGPNVRLGWERQEIQAPIATINSEPIDPKGPVVSVLRGESAKGAGGNWEGVEFKAPKCRKVYEAAVSGEPMESGQHYVEVTWQEGHALWVGVVGPDFDPTIPRHMVQDRRGALMKGVAGAGGGGASGKEGLIVEDATGASKAHSGEYDKTRVDASDVDDPIFAATAGNHKSGYMYDVATGHYKHHGKSKVWSSGIPVLVPKGQAAGSGRIGLLLDFDDGSLSIYVNDRLVGPMVKRGLVAPLYWAVDLGSGDPYDDGFVVSQKGKGMGKRFRQTRVSKAFQAVSVPCTAKIESAPMPEIEYESD